MSAGTVESSGCGSGAAAASLNGNGLWRSLVSASVWGTEGREFKSPQPDRREPDASLAPAIDGRRPDCGRIQAIGQNCRIKLRDSARLRIQGMMSK